MFAKLSGMLLFLASLNASSAELIEWKDLIPAATQTVELPALTQEQVTHLYRVLKLKNTQQSRDLTTDELNEYQQSQITVQQSGFTAEELLSLREKALEIEQQRLASVRANLNLKNVTIPGYVVPLEFDGVRTTKFLLVPFAGACIHTPPPPANQTIIVEIEQGFALKDLYQVITVTGDISTFEQRLPISYVDGTDDVSTGYSMTALHVNYM